MQKLIYDHNKILYRTNVNYFPYIVPIFKIEQKKHQQRDMRIHQPFSIAMIKVDSTSILSSSFSNVTYTFLLEENSPIHIQYKIIIF